MTKQPGFVIIQSDLQSEFEQQVYTHLKEGYRLHGVTGFIPHPDSCNRPLIYVQAMISDHYVKHKEAV
jgi:hypothetical protein